MTSVAGVKRPGPSTGLSVAVLVVGAVLAVFGLVKAVAPFVDTLTSSSFATPGVSHMNLSKGTYLVYQAPGGSAITTDDVTITADSGGSVNTRAPRYRQELTRGSDDYVGVVEFEITRSGGYTIEIGGASAGRAIVARSIEDTVRDSLWWWALLGFGGLTAITGVVMWIVGATRRRRQRFAVPMGPPPPGWYPDPENPGQQRYWNGSAWTEHRA